MSRLWTDTEAIASALHRQFPEAEPLDFSAETLRARVMALTEFREVGAAMALDTLRAVQMLWYELTQAEAGDVSG